MSYNNFFSQGLISEEQLKKISYLSYTKEAKEIVALLTTHTRRYKKYLRSAFILDFISTLFVFLVLCLIPLLLQLDLEFIIVIAVIYLFFHIVVVIIRARKLSYLNRYIRIVEDLGDNLISVIFNDYRSLEDRLPNYESVKRLTRDLARSASALREYFIFIKEMSGIIFGITVLIIISITTRQVIYLHLIYVVLTIITLFIIFTTLEGVYRLYKIDYDKKTRKYDESFVNSYSLLTRTELGFVRDEYLSNLRPLAALTDNTGIVGLINRNLLPIIFLFLPIILVDFTSGLVLLIVGLFVSNRLFSIANPLKSKAVVMLGQRRLRQLSRYLDTILEHGSEITPNLYKKIRRDYLDKNPREKVGDRLIWGDLHLEGLNYATGWGKNQERIYVDKLSLPHRKVSLLVGDYGIGKTLFGRLVTLRYTNFSADCLSLGQKDLRTFSSLGSGIKYLHFSGLRDISTSYRNVLSIYIKQAGSTNNFLKKIFNFEENLTLVKDHFAQNTDYYGELIDDINEVLSDFEVRIDADDYKKGYLDLIASIFQNLGEAHSLELVLSELSKKIDQRVIKKGLLYACVAEYISFQHLKNYVPEANIYFMDANLAKPPISKEMRLRFLFALDIFIEGLVFVIDEPFSNLDIGSAKRIFEDLTAYAKNYNAVVLILDEKIYPEILDDYKGKNILGKIMRFEDDGFSINIKANDLEIS